MPQAREPIALPRRLVMAALTLLCAVFLFRAQLASALVDRGDAGLGSGDLPTASRLYERALWFSPHDPLVAERLSFAAYLAGDAALEEHVLGVTEPIARANPTDAELWMNIGLCALRLHNQRSAAQAFREAGIHAHDARALTLAGWAYTRLGQYLRAQSAWRTALQYDPDFIPARHALATHRGKA